MITLFFTLSEKTQANLCVDIHTPIGCNQEMAMEACLHFAILKNVFLSSLVHCLGILHTVHIYQVYCCLKILNVGHAIMH